MILIKKRKIKGLTSYLCMMAVALFSVGCSNKNNQTIKMTGNTKTDTISETYVELGFFGTVKQGKWADLVQAVQNNIAYSRKEPGNISFSLYQAEGDTLPPIWFERFKTKEAHNFHKQQSHFKNAITVIQQSLAGEAHAIILRELKEIPATIPKLTGTPKDSYNIITLFDVKPENRQRFITALKDTTHKYRGVAGNLEYSLYQYKDEPYKFVLIQGWENKTHYDAMLKEHVKLPNAEWFTAKPIVLVVKDISQ